MFAKSIIMYLVMIMAICFCGCSNNSKNLIVDPPPPPPVWSIDGVVLDSVTHTPLGGLYVVYWGGEFVRDSVMTSEDGFFLISETFNSGEYYISVIDPDNEYTTSYISVYIPTIYELKGDIDVNPSGSIHYDIHFWDNCEAGDCRGAILLTKK